MAGFIFSPDTPTGSQHFACLSFLTSDIFVISLLCGSGSPFPFCSLVFKCIIEFAILLNWANSSSSIRSVNGIKSSFCSIPEKLNSIPLRQAMDTNVNDTIHRWKIKKIHVTNQAKEPHATKSNCKQDSFPDWGTQEGKPKKLRLNPICHHFNHYFFLREQHFLYFY